MPPISLKEKMKAHGKTPSCCGIWRTDLYEIQLRTKAAGPI